MSWSFAFAFTLLIFFSLLTRTIIDSVSSPSHIGQVCPSKPRLEAIQAVPRPDKLRSLAQQHQSLPEPQPVQSPQPMNARPAVPFPVLSSTATTPKPAESSVDTQQPRSPTPSCGSSNKNVISVPKLNLKGPSSSTVCPTPPKTTTTIGHAPQIGSSPKQQQQQQLNLFSWTQGRSLPLTEASTSSAVTPNVSKEKAGTTPTSKELILTTPRFQHDDRDRAAGGQAAARGKGAMAMWPAFNRPREQLSVQSDQHHSRNAKEVA